MEHVQTDAIRLPDGTELYTSLNEASMPFITPGEVERYHKFLGSIGMVAQLANMPRSVREKYRDAPDPLHNRGGRFFWVRYPEE